MKKYFLGCLITCRLLPLSLSIAQAQPYTFSTVAGMAGTSGAVEGTNGVARFNYPNGIALDAVGNVYVSDSGNCTIRKITAVGVSWVVSTIAGAAQLPGSTDGIGGTARFRYQDGMKADASGNLYVADWGNNTIRKITQVGTNWEVSTIAGSPGVSGRADGTNAAARFFGPLGLAIDPFGNLFVTDQFAGTIRKMTRFGTNWSVTTIAGGYPGSADGTNSSAEFLNPYDLTIDPDGNIFVADADDYAIRKITPVGTNWIVTTIAGLARVQGVADGTNNAARFGRPTCISSDRAGNLFVGDSWSNTVRKITAVGNDWVVTTIGGSAGVPGSNDGTGSTARFQNLRGIAVSPAGDLYLADADANTIRLGLPIPSLQFTLSSYSLLLSWPTSASNYLLETSSTLGAGASWSPNPNRPVISANNWILTNLLNSPTAFFRLRRL